MARTGDQTSDSHTLPPAQLNPLLNPLLAEHMGRWAEVYFTSPPENREQAVLELLRELEAEKSRHEGEISTAFLVRCKSCGHDNPPSHRFCGMCGAIVGEDDALPSLHSDSNRADSEEQRARRDAAIWRSPATRSSDPQQREEEWSSEPRSYAPPTNNNELSLFQSYRGNDSDAGGDDNDWEFEPPPSHPFRGYLAAVLAILIAGLGYMAWRGTQTSQGSHLASPAPPVAATEPPPADTPADHPAAANEASSAAPANLPAEASHSKPPESETAATTAAAAAPKERETKPVTTKAERTRAVRSNSVPSADPGDVPPSNVGGKGSEELAVAQRYLNGTSGQRRDTAEASKWLWKSIAKHNSQATLLLADLYLKGDGVSKNCDQARVLLYSAARKGVSGAGERLRNLPAFGCQ